MRDTSFLKILSAFCRGVFPPGSISTRASNRGMQQVPRIQKYQPHTSTCPTHAPFMHPCTCQPIVVIYIRRAIGHFETVVPVGGSLVAAFSAPRLIIDCHGFKKTQHPPLSASLSPAISLTVQPANGILIHTGRAGLGCRER